MYIYPDIDYGVWEGWGASLCWWANVFGNRDDLADLLFTTKYTTLNGTSLPGLGMNIARYNVGACSWNSINGETMNVSPNIPAYRQMPGFWINWSSDNPSSSSWTWSVDANQRNMLLKAKARGANHFELFSNSPMWWMCYNHNPSGSWEGTTDNLQSWNYRQHAVYLATVAKYYKDNYGISFGAVEPFNEPTSSWWDAWCAQEGCHFEVATQATVIGHLRSELYARGLHSVRIAASDETSYNAALATWTTFSETTKAQVGRVNVHGYQSFGNRSGLYEATFGKQLWNSEYGENDTSGATMVRNLNLDFYQLHPTAWCYWQPFDGSNWGLVNANLATSTIGTVNQKYYALAQYTRHIRPGMKIIDGGFERDCVVAYSASEKKLVIVMMNYDFPETYLFDLSGFQQADGPVRRWRTSVGSGGTDKYVRGNDLAVSDWMVSASIPANTLETFEVLNVEVEATPHLVIEKGAAAGQIKLSWPASAVDYQLYTSPAMNESAQWTLVTSPTPTVVQDLNVLVLPHNGSRQFFRLGKP